MGRTLEFAPGGKQIMVASHDGLHVVDLATRVSRREPITELRAFAAVGTEIWTVAGTPASLGVIGFSERLALPGAAGSLIRGPGAQAMWIANGTSVFLVRGETGLEATPLTGIEFALPISNTRMIATQRNLVQLRDTTTTRWTASPVNDGVVTDGAMIFDGRSVALHIEQRGTAGMIAVLDTRDGRVQHRIAIRAATAVRFAGRRGVALVVVERRRLVLIDLRFGRVLADHALARDVADIAIDDAGQQIALCHAGDTEIVEIDVEELLRAPRHVEVPTEPGDERAHEIAEPAQVSIETVDVPVARMARGSSQDLVPAPAPAPAPAPVPDTITLRACPSLPVRILPPQPGALELRQLLAAQRALVTSLVTQAIATAWDEGRATPERGASLRNQIDGIAGALHGLAENDVLDANARVETAIETWHATLAAMAPRVAPLVQLAAEHDLGTLDQLILLLVAGPALWGELARLYGILVNDSGRPLVDELFVSAALAAHAHASEIAAALDPTSPLVRGGLVRVGEGLHRPFLPLTVDPVVLRLLRGASPEPAFGLAVEIRRATRSFDELHLRAPLKTKLVDDLARAGRPLRLVVRGRSGSGRHTLLATIAASTGRDLAIIDAGALPRLEDLELAIQRVTLAGLVPCVDGLERSKFAEAETRDALRAMFRRHGGALAIRLPLGDTQVPLDPGYLAIDLPAQTLTERTETWTRSLARAGLAVADISELATRFSIGPGIIERVVGDVARDPGPRVAERLDAAVRQYFDSQLGDVATRVTRLADWSQVVLPADIQDSVAELIGRIRHRRTVYDTWGFDRVMSTSRGVTALFQGGPGTGKTLVAGAIANELGLDLYRVDVSRIMSKWLGETEQKLSKLFDAAEEGNAIILFDEADSLFAKRTEVKSSNDRFANLEVNYLLQRLDTFEGIAIMTTNFGTSIDSAFKRRLSFRLTFPFPDEDARERLWRAHIPRELPVRGDIDFAAIGRKYQMSGGYIRSCALRAAFLAAEQGGSLTAAHLERAIKAEFREIGKLAETGVLE